MQSGPHRSTTLARMSVLLLTATPLLATAQVTLKPDGKWRYLFTAGANASTGNSKSSNILLAGEAARVSEIDKWTFSGQAARASSDSVTTTERYLFGTQYNRDIAERWFGFGTADALRDKPANISSRYSLATGLGYHVIKTEPTMFDVSAGLGYSRDRYVTPADVAGGLRDSYGRAELVLAEESNHKLTDTTSLRQRFAVLPNLSDSGQYRATFDTHLTVAMTSTLNLTAGISYRYNSDPGSGLKKLDGMFVTGVSLRFD